MPREVKKSHTVSKCVTCGELARFNKILTRFAIQAKGPDEKWTRKPLAYREFNNVHLRVTRLLRYVSTLFLNIVTQLAVTQSVDNLLH